MPRFVPGRPVVTAGSTVTVDGLPPGRHRFRLVVVDDAGNRSRPDEVVVQVRAGPTRGPGPGRRRPPTDPGRSGSAPGKGRRPGGGEGPGKGRGKGRPPGGPAADA